MKVTILQTALRPGRVGDMLRAADRLVASAPPSSLYVLPEMWVTGFTTSPTAATAAAGGEALDARNGASHICRRRRLSCRGRR